jgi:hypothetical protein
MAAKQAAAAVAVTFTIAVTAAAAAAAVVAVAEESADKTAPVCRITAVPGPAGYQLLLLLLRGQLIRQPSAASSPLCQTFLAASCACLDSRVTAAAAAAAACRLPLLPLAYVLPNAVSQLLSCEVLACSIKQHTQHSSYSYSNSNWLWRRRATHKGAKGSTRKGAKGSWGDSHQSIQLKSIQFTTQLSDVHTVQGQAAQLLAPAEGDALRHVNKTLA